MTKPLDPNSPFNWKGAPSIFTTGSKKSAQDFNGANTKRSEQQTRLEPRPTYIVSESKYMQQQGIGRWTTHA